MNKAFLPFAEHLKKNPPRHRRRIIPYVAFGFFAKEYGKEHEAKREPGQEYALVPSMHVLNCTGAAGQPGMIDYYVRDKGYEVIGFWFPTDEQFTQMNNIRVDAGPQPSSVGKFGGSGNPYRELIKHLDYVGGISGKLDEKDAEIDALQAKIKELSEKKKGA